MAEAHRALVFGIDSQIGLTVVRELAAHGVQVYGIGHSRRALGLYSRATTRGWVLETSREPVEVVNELARDFGIPFLLVIGESDINYFNANREALVGIRPLIPAPHKMALVLDKLRIYEIAGTLGIETPHCIQPEREAEIAAICEQVNYPVVLKWRNPHAVQARLASNGLALQKKRYCYDKQTLGDVLHRYDAVGQYPIVQSFAPGYGIGQMFFMYDGKAILRFQHRRVREWPPEGGASTVCESVPVEPSLMENSIELLRRIGWEGPAMVEYRYDQGAKRAVLMEINGRFWGSLPLSYYARAPFAWLTYSMLGMHETPDLHDYKVGLRCSSLVPDVKRLYRILFRPDLIENKSLRLSKPAEIASFLVTHLDPRHRGYVFHWLDPLPAIADLYFGLREVINFRPAKKEHYGAVP